MAVERAKVNIADKLAGRALVGQPRRPGQQRSLDCRVKRRPRPPRRPAVSNRHKLFSLNGIAPKLALAPFFFGPQRCGPLARHPPLIEAHGRNPLDAPIYDGPARSHNGKFSSAFLKKKQTCYAHLEHFG